MQYLGTYLGSSADAGHPAEKQQWRAEIASSCSTIRYIFDRGSLF
jgi:hypothetical protein